MVGIIIAIMAATMAVVVCCIISGLVRMLSRVFVHPPQVLSIGAAPTTSEDPVKGEKGQNTANDPVKGLSTASAHPP